MQRCLLDVFSTIPLPVFIEESCFTRWMINANPPATATCS